MTHRERWMRALHFEPVDHVPDEEFGYWDNTLAAWHQQGLPEEIRCSIHGTLLELCGGFLRLKEIA